MTHDKFAEWLEIMQKEEKEVRKHGQKEYARDGDNAFANFEWVASMLNRGRDNTITREDVLMVYALKHLDGITSYLNGHDSQREDVRGRIKDLRMYLALLRGMIEENVSKG